MNYKRLSQLSLLACLCVGSSACIIRGSSGPEHYHRHTFDLHEGMQGKLPEDTPKQNATPVQAGAESKTAQAASALKQAELEFERSLLRIQGEMREAQLAGESAQVELENAERAVEEFVAQRKLKLDEAQLSLDRSMGQASDAELELAELQAMYDEEDFAEKTKELVLNRGRRNLEHSQRALALAKEELRQLLEHELPAGERKLAWDLKLAREGVDKAQRELAIAALAMKIDTLQAEQDRQEARQEHKVGS